MWIPFAAIACVLWIGGVVGWLMLHQRRDPYHELGVVEGHRVARRDTGQEFER